MDGPTHQIANSGPERRANQRADDRRTNARVSRLRTVVVAKGVTEQSPSDAYYRAAQREARDSLVPILRMLNN
jgi:hypothetical protein